MVLLQLKETLEIFVKRRKVPDSRETFILNKYMFILGVMLKNVY